MPRAVQLGDSEMPQAGVRRTANDWRSLSGSELSQQSISEDRRPIEARETMRCLLQMREMEGVPILILRRAPQSKTF
jgi:hypothetical protein